jgi:hypothetical protein
MHWIPESGKRCPAECGLETLSTSTPCDATCRLYPQNALRISFHCPETMLGTSCDMSVGFSSFECGRVFSSIRSMNRTKCPLMRERAQLPTCPPRSSRGQVQHLQVPVLQRSACRMPSNSIHPALPGGALATAGASRDAKHVTTDAVPLRNRLARVYLCRRLLDKPARRLRHVENGTRFASGSVSR